MSTRLLFIFTLLTALPAAGADVLPCAVPGGDPCLISSQVSIPVGIYDITPRSLIITRALNITGIGDLAITAANVTLGPLGRINVIDTTGRTNVALAATGTLTMQSDATGRSHIDVSGSDAGNIDLDAAGDITINGVLISQASGLS